jgi:hypothetical protein
MSRAEWKPPVVIPSDHLYFSDAALGPAGDKGCRLDLSSSSYVSELHGMERLTSLAVDDDIENSTIIFVSDNAGILSSIKQRQLRHMRQSEYRIYQNLQRLIARCNKVKFRHVISHAIDNSDEHDPKRCADTIGNQQVDQHCSAID